MAKDNTIDELNKMISLTKEKEFLDLEENEESLPPENNTSAFLKDSIILLLIIPT